MYGKNDDKAWNKCVKSFKNWDIYYLYEYAYSFMIHGDGDILLVYFENDDDRFCYVVMQRDIADENRFLGAFEKDRYYDWQTPYGYGGPLADSSITEISQEIFKNEIIEYCEEHHIVSQFIRFHPLLKNYQILPDIIETRYLRDTIFMDTSNSDVIMSNMDSKNRNMVRKAQKKGVNVIKKSIDNIDEFIPMYNETMRKNGADDYYIFNKEYYDSICDMRDNAFIMYAIYDNRPISGSIMYFNDRYLHYHLSGSYTEYRDYSPNNLLLYEAAQWASENGIKMFHLGGGMSPDDSLFGFKKQFNKNGRAPFVVGRTIFLKEEYVELLRIRKKIDPEFNIDNNFMIQYRR